MEVETAETTLQSNETESLTTQSISPLNDKETETNLVVSENLSDIVSPTETGSEHGDGDTESSLSMVRRRSKEQKKKTMIRYLKQLGTLFNQFLDTSAEKTKAKPSRGKRRLSVHKEDDDSLFDDSEANLIHITCQPSCIQGTMRPYQIEALSWLVNQYQLGVNSILADEMGLGKTLETISLLGFLRQYLGVTGPHLILVPLSTLGNWLNELRRFCPSIRAPDRKRVV